MIYPLPQSPTVDFAALLTKPSHLSLWVIMQTLAIFLKKNLSMVCFPIFQVE